MSIHMIPLSLNFGEKITELCLNDADYKKLKELLFIDGTSQPRSVILGTMLADFSDGDFNIVEMSIVTEQAYQRRLDIQRLALKGE